nr:BspA family leucine-rich repeat surface protein [uncultured Bacteroides sp.]
MFKECCSLESLDLSCFETSNVTNMNKMFAGCDSLKKVIMRGCNKNTIDDIIKALEETDVNAKIITD